MEVLGDGAEYCKKMWVILDRVDPAVVWDKQDLEEILINNRSKEGSIGFQ